jgi:hypothetical protein
MPKVGSRYEKKMRDGTKHVLTVVEVRGEIKFQLGRQIFDSPSGAAKYIKGGREVNGWVFWKIDR